MIVNSQRTKGYYYEINPNQLTDYQGELSLMKFNVTEVEFDFDDDYAEESKLTFDEEIEIQ